MIAVRLKLPSGLKSCSRCPWRACALLGYVMPRVALLAHLSQQLAQFPVFGFQFGNFGGGRSQHRHGECGVASASHPHIMFAAKSLGDWLFVAAFN